MHNGKIKVLTVFGTRPEAIKMAPLVKEFEAQSEFFRSFVCVTAQHREMLDEVLQMFDITPDFDLNVMQQNQDLHTLTAKILNGTKEVFEKVNPDIVLVHGDTTTAAVSSLSAFYMKIPVGHVEAGLRTFDKYNPFPEEINRVIADGVSSYLFAPTSNAAKNLEKNGTDKRFIFQTGNTVIDALFYILKNKSFDVSKILPDNGLRTITVTAHRRENFGKPLENICKALIKITEENPDVQIIYPVHPNPNVRNTAEKFLKEKERIILTSPLGYSEFASLVKHSHLVLSDSGGIQEEAPSLGKPVLVLRQTTERPEAVECGTVKLVGTDTDVIVRETNLLLRDKSAYDKMANTANPYGDGTASKQIAQIIKNAFVTDKKIPAQKARF